MGTHQGKPQLGGIHVAVMILSLIFNCGTAGGLRMCYHCNTTMNIDCVRNPTNVTDCKGYCTIMRRDYLYMPEDASLIFLQRKCEVNPPFLDTVEVIGYYKTYYRSCKSYLCNVGLGIKSLRDIPADPYWDQYTDEEGEASKASLGWKPTLVPPWGLYVLFFLLVILHFEH